MLFLLKQQCCCFLLLLLLFVIVYRMAKFGAGSLNLIPVFSFSSFRRDLFLAYPLAVLSPRFACSTFSVITGIRGAKAAINPPRRIPPGVEY